MNQDIINDYQSEAEIFKALAHPTRLFIVHAIKDKSLSVKELTEMIGVDISTVSKHLDVLKRHKIVVGEKHKNNVFYTLNIPCVLDFMSCANRILNKS